MPVPNEAYDSVSQNPTVEDIRGCFCITPFVEVQGNSMSKRGGLLYTHDGICQDARATMIKKNQDYATEQDVFKNFRMFGGLGILVRMSDKLARLRNFEEKAEFSVSDESLRDTIEDLINYAVIYLAYKQEGK